MVEDYLKKKKLAKLGFSFDGENLSDLEISCYMIIDDQFNTIELEKLERSKK